MGKITLKIAVTKVPMSPTARQLFDLLRDQVKAIDADILEIAEQKSVSYHGPTVFLEVLPRKNRLALLLALDSFVARFVRGSRTVLSNHAFGSAFDINEKYNSLGSRPTLVGEKGSLRELVPIANRWGFYWGGH